VKGLSLEREMLRCAQHDRPSTVTCQAKEREYSAEPDLSPGMINRVFAFWYITTRPQNRHLCFVTIPVLWIDA
jgi:hypothetical protein